MEPAGQPAQSLSPDNPKFPQKVRDILHKAQTAWLKNTEVCDVLMRYSEYNLPVARDPPHLPPGGSLFLFDRRAVRFFRKDAHNWRKKADGKTVRETHEKLKVGNVEMLNCYYAHADTEEGQQQSTRLQRRCYWLLESEDDIVLVHYLNIDKAKGKTEDTWTATDSDMSRRAGFTVTSGGIHNIQALPHSMHLPGQPPHMPVQPGLESYIPLMPSLSLDSFFASCDERDAAARHAQQPPAMMENVLPAWGEDLNNAPGGSLQAGADWQAMLRGDSLAMSEGAPALVEHGGSLMMIEPGMAPGQEGWAQDIPAAMRTPSLEARQARAAALMRQNMELQQRQSSLERRAAFQKGLMAANRDHMQAAAAAALLQQAQGNQGNGAPFTLTAFQQRLIAAARQGQPGAQAQLQSLLRQQDMSAAQAMASGMVGQMSQQAFNQQMPPPPPPGQQQRPGGAPGQGGQQPGAFSGRLPPLQQPGGAFPAPQPRPVASDWARAYREQQNKAAQAALARSAKWGTTEPSGRPSPSRQGSQGSGQLEALGSAGSGGLSSRPPLSGMESPRPTKLDALLQAQQLAQQQQQQQQQQSGSSSQDGRPAGSGLAARRAFSGQLPATQSAAQLGVNGAQVKVEASNSEGTVTGVPSLRESNAARLAQALALEAQVRGVDGQIREQLTTATSGNRSVSLDSRVQRLGSDVQQLEAESQRLLTGTEAAQPNGRSEASSCGGRPGGPAVHSLELLDFSPNWDFTLGGSKVLVTCREADGEVSSSSPVCIMFGKEEVPATRLQRGVYRCHAPPHEAGMVSLSITWGDGSPCSNAQPFTYRVTPQTARAQDDLARAAIPDRDLQLRLIHMLMGGRSSSSGANQQSPSTSSDSGNRKMHSGSTVSPGHDSSAPDIDAAALSALPNETIEALLQRLLEQKLRTFATQVKEGKSRLRSSWPARYAVNERAQSGLALIHILAALGYDWGLQLLLPLGAKLNLQDAWGRTALHWAAAYACEASVVLLLVRGAHAALLSHGGEAQPALAPGDMAAAAGHLGLAAFLSEHALMQLMKDHNVTLDDPMTTRDAGESMSLRKRARSLRRADSASELPILRETMATPAAAVSISEDDGATPAEVLAKAKRMSERVKKAQQRLPRQRAAVEQSGLRKHRKEAAALLRIEQRLQEWQNIQSQAPKNAQRNPALVQLGQRIARLNTAIKSMIQDGMAGAAKARCAPVSEGDETAAGLPAARTEEVLDYGSDSDLPMMRADTLARRRSLYHLRESRRRDSITKIKGMETDEALRDFLTRGAHRAGRADEAGPSAADLRELRSLSLSFSLAGAPIGVSLAESDLTDLRCFLQGKSIPSLRDGKLSQKHISPFGSIKESQAAHKAHDDQAKPMSPCMLQRAVAHIEQLGSSQTGFAQYMRLRQAYMQLTTHQPNSAYKQARRGSLSFAV